MGAHDQRKANGNWSAWAIRSPCVLATRRPYLNRTTGSHLRQRLSLPAHSLCSGGINALAVAWDAPGMHSHDAVFGVVMGRAVPADIPPEYVASTAAHVVSGT